MSNGPKHEDVKHSLGQFVNVIAEEMAIPCKGLGETTWMRPGLPGGLECDVCYYFLPEKLAEVSAIAWSNDVSGYPNPDLAIEVDISRPQVDRAGIYAALRVAEVWRFNGDDVAIERLTPDGTYGSCRCQRLSGNSGRGNACGAGLSMRILTTSGPGHGGCEQRSEVECQARNKK